MLSRDNTEGTATSNPSATHVHPSVTVSLLYMLVCHGMSTEGGCEHYSFHPGPVEATVGFGAGVSLVY